MRPDIAAETQDWLWRAERDLQAANLMLNSLPVLSDAAAFHAQQPAEKAIKGFLTAHSKIFPKSHILQPLVTQCVGIDPKFGQFMSAAMILSPYAIEFRYPGGRLEPMEAEASEAVRLATEILQYVRDALADASSPQPD
jgi:HEPN domain-containing protein